MVEKKNVGYSPEDSTLLKNVFDHYFFDLKYYLHEDASIEYFSHLLKVRVEKVGEFSKFYYTLSIHLLVTEQKQKNFIEGNDNSIKASLSVESIFQLNGFDCRGNFLNKSKKIDLLIN